MKKFTIEELQKRLAEKFGGYLSAGSHSYGDGKCCALELMCDIKSCDPPISLTDSPEKTGMPDLRELNDAYWSSYVDRTKYMLPILSAYSDWEEWSEEKKALAMETIAIEYARKIIPPIFAHVGLDYLASMLYEAINIDSANVLCKRAQSLTNSKYHETNSMDYASTQNVAVSFIRLSDNIISATRYDEKFKNHIISMDYSSNLLCQFALSVSSFGLDYLIGICKIWVEAAGEKWPH